MKTKYFIAISILGLILLIANGSHACYKPPCTTPGVFSLSAPEDNSTFTSTEGIVLEWGQSSSADFYCIYLAEDGQSLEYQDYTSSRYWPVPSSLLEYGKTYNWRIQARNTGGSCSMRWRWSTETWSFTVFRVKNITQNTFYGTIQPALEDADEGDTIMVIPGTYAESLDFTDQEITLTSTDPEDPAVVAATIIDGGSGGSVVRFDSGDADSEIAGFTITNGKAVNGGGIYCYKVSPTIRNCVITDNEAYHTYANGGGIYCEGTEGFTASPTISGCIISENYTTGSLAEGGGIYCGVYSNLTISDCIIKKNKAPNGGGMSCISAATITHSVFNLNEADAPGTPAGGGICSYYKGNLTIRDCVFVNNKGGYWGGGIFSNCDTDTYLKLTNCIFWYNSAGNLGGGGVFINETPTTLTNCTFYGNDGFKGGGMRNYSSSLSPTVVNCIFWGNTDRCWYTGTAEAQIYGGSPNVTYCCIEDEDSDDIYIPFGGEGNDNIDDDPLFVSASEPAGPDRLFGTRSDGLFLATDSPCIDSGSNSAVEVYYDIIGNERFTDGDHSGDPDVDMGPYEVPRIWFVDYEKDGEGTSWNDAFDKLQDALGSADGGDEIWVADGTYYPYEGPDPGEHRSDSFQLVGNVGVYGGFLGTETETTLIDRNWTANATILSGDIDASGENDSFHVVKAANGAILDGFIITGGNADGSGYDEYGGGIFCYWVSFTLGNCAIIDNHCIHAGGGMYCEDSSPTVTNCIFADNTAEWGDGAGVCILRYSESGESYPVFTNCVFSKNVANIFHGYGGGIFLRSSFYPISARLTNCTFYGNQAYEGGGMLNCICLGNTAVTNCVFWGNTATYSSQIYTYYEGDYWKPTFSHCDIQDCGGSGEYWDSDLGADAGGNIDSNPCFDNTADLDGTDNTWATDDDGLMPGSESPCINAAHFRHSLLTGWTDVTGRVRDDVSSYPDIGAYESKYKIILAMCFIDETHGISYYDDEENPSKYDTDMAGFEDLLADLPYDTDYSIVKAGCIVPPYDGDGYEDNIADVLPEGFFEGDPPLILWPEEEPIGLSIAECYRPPTGDELIDHFNRIREGVVPDCIVRIIDGSYPLSGLLGEGYEDEFKPWLEDWLEAHGLDPTDESVLPDETYFTDEQWIKAITTEIDGILGP